MQKIFTKNVLTFVANTVAGIPVLSELAVIGCRRSRAQAKDAFKDKL